MTRTLHIDFVSDIVCPWCAVGLGGLTQALETLKAVVVEGKWLISGGQPAGVFEEALRKMAGSPSPLGGEGGSRSETDEGEA